MIDLYCERLGPGFWAEPLNAATNLAYLAAAVALWRSDRRGDFVPGSTRLVAGLLATVGIGSFLFHTFATTWARWLDVLPILVFEAVFLWLFARRFAGRGPVVASVLTVVFVVSAVVVRQFPEAANGSLFYVPTVAAVAWVVVVLARSPRSVPRWVMMLLSAGIVAFGAALAFRTMDLAVCSSLPSGTHFLWHLLSGGAAYCLSAALLVAPPRRVESSEGPDR